MSALNPTPADKLIDQRGRPYFLWDTDTTLVAFAQHLRDEDPETRAYWVGKLMRQAKPDDVFTFVTLGELRDLWPRTEPYLGKTRAFWQWLMRAWKLVP